MYCGNTCAESSMTSFNMVYQCIRRPSSIFKDIMQNCSANQSQISCGASMSIWNDIGLGYLSHMTRMAATSMHGITSSKSSFPES